jgi:hypothetical protein
MPDGTMTRPAQADLYPPYEDTAAAAESDVGDASEGPGLEEGGVQTALIPKSVLGGRMPNPGDEITFRVVHIYEDEVEVELAGGREEPEEEEETGEEEEPYAGPPVPDFEPAETED